MPWRLERALISKRLAEHGQHVNWWEMDDLDIAKVKQSLSLLNTFELFQAYGEDLENIKTEAQAEAIAAIEKLRSLLRDG